ncbi:MAG: hypothetical protein WDN46_20475 [Methylocella sp.]
MKMRRLTAVAVATLFFGGVAIAQNTGAGDTSRSASGKNVNPSTAVQKDQGRSESSGAAAGAPGVEGKPGSKSGATANPYKK